MEMCHVQLWINLVLNVAMIVTMVTNWSDQTLECVKSLVPGLVSNQSVNWSNVDRLPHLKMVSSHVPGTTYSYGFCFQTHILDFVPGIGLILFLVEMIIIRTVNICVQLDLYSKAMIRGYVKLMDDGPADGLIVNRSLVIYH